MTRSTLFDTLVGYPANGEPLCGSSMELGLFVNWKYHWNVWNEPSAVSEMLVVAYPAILPSFQQNLMLTLRSFDTSISNVMEGKTYAYTVDHLTHTKSSDMGHQKMLLNSLHDCHFSTINSVCVKKILTWIVFIRLCIMYWNMDSW